MIFAITALFIFQLLGEVLVQLLGIPLPGPLAGMLLLTVALFIRNQVPEPLENTANHILQHLMLLFIPAVTGVMMYFERVASEWRPFLLATLGGTVLTLVVTGVVLNYLLNKEEQA
ncbi:CidA/LrgA family protein [Alcaligenes endophyticus]|uniref:CidA/LrgA family protein n=1 Tax=Alcaligenes endophyticus TaxID=1929088 RepID=A0ABT8EG68_9BURK|nr:CidA/LrgA family protein [Alcaligenes endophyticus]MCX5590051.1 CidA/LrgA family protein [Alcaligenes endophyticus]MDN4120286.1 CidA/LrgA family protein [Alcaligenes endophyticus]